MLKSFLSLWLKFPCPLCQRITENTICQYCTEKLQSCQFSNPQQYWRGHLPLFAWGKYDRELSRGIAALKYHNQPEIGIILGQWLGESWLKNCPVSRQNELLVVPIPLHQKKQQARGFNQAESIARGFCQVTKHTLMSKGISRIKETQAMFGLNPMQRQKNLQGAFQIETIWRKTPPQKPILLVDDIYTMGTTIKEVARLFRQANISLLGAIAVAKTVRDH